VVKLIIGLKGTGKTKTLIGMVNSAIDSSDGAVVCLEKGDKLRYDIRYQARLIDVAEYGVDDGQALYGFIAGIYASNSDITHIFIDSAIKMCKKDIDAFSMFVREAAAFAEKWNINIVMTSSVTEDMLPDDIKQYI
jgi:hypothetical protein